MIDKLEFSLCKTHILRNRPFFLINSLGLSTTINIFNPLNNVPFVNLIINRVHESFSPDNNDNKMALHVNGHLPINKGNRY